mmetsp:Transcript_32724/g.51154  ORF Transcript_32724/g.51154 Transcript_32724/m.51154 type:complete len:328 (-) Transcript_32724:66-1049(-)|eukprot:CAMPEP_0201511764 /NCGR_PEP_ID=MMETSP0161_2-20130828/4168_1 /ASSEMBLY_ACC=CAM_ASM_000251 /TAXON_ID=180227 /ORGANISM="Neoparamoeba aestuarina, Strain SoJaBio B1-5/56/2" /LENGTH=327 /DNA_ID=CAMNT_0047907375 /DNA_START=59 /DNA_END=1042 /DNA_ORIENTATION=+
MTEGNEKGKGWQDWPGLLKWTMQFQDGITPSGATEMDQEKRKWLEEALAAVAEGEVGGMKKDLQIICHDCGKCFDESLTSEELQVKEQAVERIHDVVDNLDNAKDLISLGGFEPLLELLECEYPSLIGHIASLLSVAVQNHPACQQHCHEVGALGHALSSFENNKNHQQTREKLMSFLSSLVRGSSPVFAPFVEGGGVKVLIDVLSDGETSDRLLTRTLFLLCCLTREFPAVMLPSWEKRLIPELICLIQQKEGDWTALESIFNFFSLISEGRETWGACGGEEVQGELVPLLLKLQKEIKGLSEEDQDPLFDLVASLNNVARNVMKK